MGKISRREKPQSPLGVTGERLISSVEGQVEIEDSRHFFALELCRDNDIVAVAGGEV